jgi:hypothetical protein
MHGEEADRELRSLPPGDPQRVLHAQRAQGLRDTLQGSLLCYSNGTPGRSVADP